MEYGIAVLPIHRGVSVWPLPNLYFLCQHERGLAVYYIAFPSNQDRSSWNFPPHQTETHVESREKVVFIE